MPAPLSVMQRLGQPMPSGSPMQQLGGSPSSFGDWLQQPGVAELLIGIGTGISEGSAPGGGGIGRGLVRGFGYGTQLSNQAKRSAAQEKRAAVYDQQVQRQTEEQDRQRRQQEMKQAQIDQYISTLPPDQQQLARLDPDKFVGQSISNTLPDPNKPPMTRTRIVGNEEVQEEFRGKEGWVEVGRGGRFAPAQPRARQTQVVNGKLIDTETGKLIADYSQGQNRETAVVGNRLIDKNTGEVIQTYQPEEGGGPFTGSSVEAQGLNMLVKRGDITPEQAAQLAAGKSVTGPNGSVLFVTPQGLFQQPAGGGPAGPVGATGGDTMPGGSPDAAQPPGVITVVPPKAPPPTQDQTAAAGFRDRMARADAILGDTETAGTDKLQELYSGVPLAGNYLKSEERQRYEQAQRDFVNAQLRKESGAVINPDEFSNAQQQYFPQPGDSPEVIKQKREARQQAVETMRRNSGAIPEPPAAAKSDAAPSKPPVAVKSEAEYNQLPPGTMYVGPDGKTRMKQ